jgi:hypothetical protein
MRWFSDFTKSEGPAVQGGRFSQAVADQSLRGLRISTPSPAYRMRRNIGRVKVRLCEPICTADRFRPFGHIYDE